MINRLKDLLEQSRHTVVFTGAGVSTLSGIRDFRGTHGVYRSDWEGLSVEDILSLEFFHANPAVFYRWAREFVYRLDDYQPSVVHTVLAEMERKGFIEGVYTQNIDMLHQKGGSRHVWEIHGSPEMHHCLDCRREIPYCEVAPTVIDGKVPVCSSCGGIVKPDIVFYGEQLNAALLDRAYRDMAEADLMMVLGSSLTVQPAASLPMATYRSGGRIVIVNAQETPLDRYAELVLRDLGTVFGALEIWLDGQPPRDGTGSGLSRR